MSAGKQKAEGRRQKGGKSPLIGFQLPIGRWRLAILLVMLLLQEQASIRAATNAVVNSDEIPPLRPPKPQLPPGFWEQNGLVIVLAALTVAIVIVVLWRVLSRPKPAIIPNPAQVARQSLESLRPAPEDAALLAEVSCVLRHFIVAAFALPHEEFTNHELCRQLACHPKTDEELVIAATDLLQGMEHRRFNTEAVSADTGAVCRALQLIDQTERVLQPPPSESESEHPKS